MFVFKINKVRLYVNNIELDRKVTHLVLFK